MKPLRAINVSQRLRPAESLRVTATRTLKTVAALLGALGAIVTLAAAEPDRLAPAAIELHPVRLPAQAPRLLAMSMDDDGAIWLGSTHRIILRYQPTTGAIEEIPIPYHSSTSTCICVGAKVYLLGQSYPRLMIYDRRRKQFSEAEYPSPKPDVWYGTEAFDGRHLYLFDRSGVGVIKWDTSTEKGKAIAYPYPGPLPSFGRHFRDALWCGVWNYNGGQYVPLGIARLDLATERFSEWIAFPKDETELQPYDQPEATLFYPHSLRGQLMPFDVEKRRWCKPLAVPEFGRRFGFIGLATLFKNRWYFSLSTYNGTEIGCDGKPYHFCNALLEFDPRTGTFAFPTLEAENAYFQISYTLAAGGHFFATGNNIRERDGTLNAGKSGDALFWQTVQRESARAK